MRTNTIATLIGASLALLSVTTGSTAAALPEPTTLENAIQTALSHHNRIAVAQSQKQAAQERETQARSAYYPTITPSFQHNSQRTSLDNGGGTSGSISRSTAGIALTQTLYDSGKREIRVAQSQDSVLAAEYAVLESRQSVILNVTTAWYELLRTQEMVRVAESGVARARATLDSTAAFVEAGSAPRKDVLQAQADYELAEVQAIQARNNTRLAQTTLKNAMGVASTEPILMPDAPAERPTIPADAPSVEDYKARALETRPDLGQSEANLLAVERNVRLARIQAGPQVTSTLSAAYQVHPDTGDDQALLVGVTYPLFDGGASRAAVREAQANAQQSRQQIELLRQDIAAEVESAYLVREEAAARLSATAAAVTAARENFEAASAARAEGAGTILDVITAQNQLVTAETGAVNSIYDFHTAQARLEYAIGANDPATTGGTIR